MSIPELVSQHFVKIQWVVLIAGIIFCFRILKGAHPKSQFKVREADRADAIRTKGGPDLAQAKLNQSKQKAPPPPPLGLPGMRMVGEPHEILGIAEDASEAEIMKAYKEAIKRFHPDRIQGQAQEQLKFYQEASSKLNSAKEEMLKRIRSN